MSHPGNTTARTGQSKLMFTLFTAVAAATAALAAGSSLLLSLPVWAMFVGWVAFFSRGLTLRDGLVNLGCVLMGTVFGTGAALSIGALSPTFGLFALPEEWRELLDLAGLEAFEQDRIADCLADLVAAHALIL